MGIIRRMATELNENALRKQLASEGFSHTFVWQDGRTRIIPTTPMPG